MLRAFSVILFVFALSVNKIIAQGTGLESLPSCAQTCIIQAILNSTCSPTNTTCVCTDDHFKSMSSQCIIGSCTIRESLTTANITNLQCGIPPQVDHSFVTPLLVFIVITGIAVCLRITSRLVTGTKFWWDDFFNVIGMGSCVAFASQSFVCAKLGLGTDIWAVPHENITKLLKYSFIQFSLYNLSRVTIRASIILFLLRAFSVALRKTLIIMFVVNALCGFVFIWVDVFQCKPVNFFWLSWDGERHGHCDNSRAIAWFSAIWDLCYDTVLLILPYRYVWQLNMPLKQRIAASIMFGFGIVTIIVSIIRVKAVNTFTIGTNTTHDGIGMFLWTGLELDIGLLCACLPSIYPLFKPMFSKVFGTQGGIDSSSKPRLVNTFNATPKKHLRQRGLYSDVSMTGLTRTSTENEAERAEPGTGDSGFARTNEMEMGKLRNNENSMNDSLGEDNDVSKSQHV